MDLHQREWGAGDPVLAMAPARPRVVGVRRPRPHARARRVAHHRHRPSGVRPRSCLPSTAHAGRAGGTGHRTRPNLERPPVVLGVSLGGRVALEAAVTAPEAFRSVIAIAPYLPWRRFRALRMRQRSSIGHGRLDSAEECMAGAALARTACSRRRRTSARTSSRRRGAPGVFPVVPGDTAKRVLGRPRSGARPRAWSDQLVDAAASMTLPAAFVWAERDQMVSLRFAGSGARHCPQARSCCCPVSGTR